MATLADLQADLTAVEAAIRALVSKQVARYSVTTAGATRSYEYHDLGTLREWRKELRAEVASLTQGGTRVRLFRFPAGF